MRHRKYEHHLDNLRKIKPSIDNRDPRRPKTGNANKARMEEERNAQIMHENTILLDKLSKILTREKGAQAGGATLPTVARPPTAGGGCMTSTAGNSGSRSTARTSSCSSGCST